MYDKRKPLPLAHISLIFTEIAHFHGRWLKWIKMARANELPADKGVTPLTYNYFKVLFSL